MKEEWLIYTIESSEKEWENLKTFKEILKEMVFLLPSGYSIYDKLYRNKLRNIEIFVNRFNSVQKAAVDLGIWCGEYCDEPRVVWLLGGKETCLDYGFILNHKDKRTTLSAIPEKYAHNGIKEFPHWTFLV